MNRPTLPPIVELTDTRVKVNDLGLFRAHQPEARADLFRWLEGHGIDPNEVAGHEPIERDPEAGQVRYTTFVRGADGKRRLLSDGLGNTSAEKALVVVEVAPQPWPPSLLAAFGPTVATQEPSSVLPDAEQVAVAAPADPLLPDQTAAQGNPSPPQAPVATP